MNAQQIAYAMSCRNEWVAFLYGDSDRQVIDRARAYARFIAREYV